MPIDKSNNAHRRAAALAIGIALIVWEVVAQVVAATSLPSVTAVLGWIAQDWLLLLVSALATTARAIVGLLLAVVFGITVGVAMALSSRADTMMSPFVNFLRPLPSSALILLFAVWFGLGPMPVLVTWIGSMWPIIISTRDQMRSIPREVHQTLDVLGLSSMSRIRFVYSRALLPGMLSGIRVAVSIALILAVTVELVVQPNSFFGLTSEWTVVSGSRNIPWALGSYMNFYYEKGAVLQILSCVVVSGIVGLAMNQAYHVFYLRALRRNRLEQRV